MKKETSVKTRRIVALFLILIGVISTFSAFEIIFKKTNSFNYSLPEEGNESVFAMLSETSYALEKNQEKEITGDEILENLQPVLSYITDRFEGSGQLLNGLIRLILEKEETLPEEIKEEIKKTALRFRFSLSEEGEDGMNFWGDSQAITFAVAEFLTAQTFSGETFEDGKTSEEHRKKALEKIKNWANEKYFYGFTNYGFLGSYPDYLLPMSNFLEFGKKADEEKEKIAMVMDLLWFDLSLQSKKISKNGTTYKFMDVYGTETENLKSYVNFAKGNIRAKDENDQVEFETNKDFKFRSFKHLIESEKYQIPRMILELFSYSNEEKITMFSQGLYAKEVEDKVENPQMKILEMGGATKEENIQGALRFIKKNKLLENEYFHKFEDIDLLILKITGATKNFSNYLSTSSQEVLKERGNVYLYQTHDNSMRTLQGYVGDTVNSQKVFFAEIGNEIPFTHQQQRSDDKIGKTPFSVQDKGVNISIYDFGRKENEKTIAPFDVESFDQVELGYLNEGYVFGRKGSAMVAIAAKNLSVSTEKGEAIELADPTKIKALTQQGAKQFWICEVSSTNEEDFESFTKRIRKNFLEFDEDNTSIHYQSLSTNLFASFNKEFKIDGKTKSLEFPKYETPFVKNNVIQRESEEINLHYDGYTWKISWKNTTRNKN